VLVEKVKHLMVIFGNTKKYNMEISRRNQLDKCTSAELAIFNAMQEVEKVGADVKLTQAIGKLQEAKDLVSDFVDKPERNLLNFICTECGYACTVSEKDTEMINFLRSKITHKHLEFGTRCDHPLIEMSESEYVGSESFYKGFIQYRYLVEN